MTFFGVEDNEFFEPKSWWKYIYWLLKSSCFELFGNGKYGLFWDKKLMQRLYFLVTEKFLFWTTEKFLFWTFWWWEIRSFLAKKVVVKVIFSWSFWAFYDIPGPGKQGFFSSVTDLMLKRKQNLTNPSYFYSLANIHIFKAPLVHLSQSFFKGISAPSSHPHTLFLANV